MDTKALIRQIAIDTLASELVRLRGDLSQEAMAEKCNISLRQFSNLERRRAAVSATTLVNLYANGIDLNHWAEEVLARINSSDRLLLESDVESDSISSSS